MGLSRQEVNLRRLLAKCELMVKSKQKDDERFPKYIESLEDMLQSVKKLIEPNNESIRTYQMRINVIKAELGITTNKYEEENEQSIRDELLGLKHRSVHKEPGTDDLDQLLNLQEDKQRKITDDMLLLTRNLKEQSELANKIIRKDTEVVTRSAQLAEQNNTKLLTESQKLQEHSKKAFKCWMWIILVIVLIVFINMVMFMKVMKKRY